MGNNRKNTLRNGKKNAIVKMKENPIQKSESDEKIQAKKIVPLENLKMKKCKVVLNRVSKEMIEKVYNANETSNKMVRENIYDYNSDADEGIDLDKDSVNMKVLLEKLARQKKIKLVKYKSKGNQQVRGSKKLAKPVDRKPNLNVQRELRVVLRPLEMDVNDNVWEKIGGSGGGLSRKNENLESKTIEVDPIENVIHKIHEPPAIDPKNENDKEKEEPNENNLRKRNKFFVHHRPTFQSTPLSTPIRKTGTSDQSTSVISNVASPILTIDNSHGTFDIDFDKVDSSPVAGSSKERINVVQMSPRTSIDLMPDIENAVYVMEETLKNKTSTVPVASKAGPNAFKQINVNDSDKMDKLSLGEIAGPTPDDPKKLEKSLALVESTPKRPPSVNHCSVMSSDGSIATVNITSSKEKKSSYTVVNLVSSMS